MTKHADDHAPAGVADGGLHRRHLVPIGLLIAASPTAPRSVRSAVRGGLVDGSRLAALRAHAPARARQPPTRQRIRRALRHARMRGAARRGGGRVGKNILIFSDGTGQAGGYMPDETRSNVYKLFRATRVSPRHHHRPRAADRILRRRARLARRRRRHQDQAVAPHLQPAGQATGLGITQNIIDCYAQIIRVWQPGDRIYLFGFSRGAYTVRCVGGVLKYCGVPTAVAARHGAGAAAAARSRSRRGASPPRR